MDLKEQVEERWRISHNQEIIYTRQNILGLLISCRKYEYIHGKPR
jgi:hypothetical protein